MTAHDPALVNAVATSLLLASCTGATKYDALDADDPEWQRDVLGYFSPRGEDDRECELQEAA